MERNKEDENKYKQQYLTTMCDSNDLTWIKAIKDIKNLNIKGARNWNRIKRNVKELNTG